MKRGESYLVYKSYEITWPGGNKSTLHISPWAKPFESLVEMHRTAQIDWSKVRIKRKRGVYYKAYC